MLFSFFLNKIAHNKDLSVEESRAAFNSIFEGDVSSDDLATFLLNLSRKGETVDELWGAALSMRSKALTIQAPPGTIDIVGTGGDGHDTYNISTAVALVVAACGVSVAKHGNRSASSRSGSSDVLESLGIKLDISFDILERCLREANVCFLFAPVHHPAMRHVGAVRKNLAVRTIFNLLGPLTNPANVTRHMIGVYDLDWLGPMAEVLKLLGSEAAWLVHGHDGMDEITTTNATDVVQLHQGMITHFTLEPEHVGLRRVSLSSLKGGDSLANAEALRQLVLGAKGAYRDIVVFNAAAALVVARKTTDLKNGITLAEFALDNGQAYATLNKLIRLTQGN